MHNILFILDGLLLLPKKNPFYIINYMIKVKSSGKKEDDAAKYFLEAIL